ncbi:DUF3679 domain-containing protein [Fictibacillus fluitans]|uniref:DUF3679 domain-containing protein n=1 Tax=Fictibacillus fluitans TaxID=3058422 RepID=A0ABT8HXE6_9BACL|nr:DUF3679 domain-containing protein [Fictibacillus sp. NE201]MDN4525453.1 DUF3679 domain-containing protein [Fictibacillus sp. NE201]
MTKFMMKCLLITAVLFFGVLLGMQQASNGMGALKGNKENGEPIAIESGKGVKEAEVLGTPVGVQDLKTKQKQLEETKAFNFFSSLGGKVSGLVSYLFQGILSLISAILTQIFGSLS